MALTAKSSFVPLLNVVYIPIDTEGVLNNRHMAQKASDHICVEKHIVKSKAFRELPARAIIILLDFLCKRQFSVVKNSKGGKHYSIKNNGEIEYCFSEAEKNGISRQSFNQNRDILIKKGFIDIVHSGCGGHKGDKNLYAISNRWKKWGTPEFEYKERAKDWRKAIGWVKYHANKNKT